MTDIPADRSLSEGEKTFLGHPVGLFVLFLTEMWERFSYYGMRALLVLYLTKHFLFERDAAFGLYGAYTTLVYITPVIGGILADRYLGQRKAVLFGAVLLVLGHLGMAVEGEPVVAGGAPDPTVLNIFYFSLALIITGVGFLKANISTIVGELYPKTDGRRDSAFTIFYVGINTGAFLGALIAGWLGETFGWAYGFGAAGIGMLLGLVVFVLGKPTLKGAGEAPSQEKLKKPLLGGLNVELGIYLGGLIGVLIIWQLVQNQSLVGSLLAVSGALTVVYILYRSFKTLGKEELHRVLAMLFFIFISILFWALFEQAGSSLNLYTDEAVDRVIFGIEVPASVFQSINSLYIITLGPIFAAAWGALAKRGLEPSTPVKFGLGVLQVGLGFLVLVAGASAAGDGLTPVIFIFLIYLLHTTGELCLSPVGLSSMTRLSVPAMVGLMMGTWFLGSAAGNYTAGLIAQATAEVKVNFTVDEQQPTAKAVGSLWFNSETNTLSRYNGSTWASVEPVGSEGDTTPGIRKEQIELITSTITNGSINEALTDNQMDFYYQNSEPKQVSTGDYWYQLEDEKWFKWADGEWVEFEDEDFGIAIRIAANAAGQVIPIYSLIGWIAIGVSIFVFAISPFIKRAMHLDSIRDVDHNLAGESEIGEPAAAGAPMSSSQVGKETR